MAVYSFENNSVMNSITKSINARLISKDKIHYDKLYYAYYSKSISVGGYIKLTALQFVKDFINSTNDPCLLVVNDRCLAVEYSWEFSNENWTIINSTEYNNLFNNRRYQWIFFLGKCDMTKTEISSIYEKTVDDLNSLQTYVEIDWAT